jgi:hypothetical protein
MDRVWVFSCYQPTVEVGPDPDAPKRKLRKPSVGRVLAQGKKAGAASVTTPDGYTFTFGQEPTEASNPWLAELNKVTKQ